MLLCFRNEKTKLSSDALLLTTEMLRIYSNEVSPVLGTVANGYYIMAIIRGVYFPTELNFLHT